MDRATRFSRLCFLLLGVPFLVSSPAVDAKAQGCPGQFLTVASGCGTCCVPQIAGTGCPTPGGSVSIDVPSACIDSHEGPQPGVLMLGLFPTQIPVGGAGCVLAVLPLTLLGHTFLPATFQCSILNPFSLPLPIPNNPGLVGVILYFQEWHLDGVGISASDRLDMIIG